MVTVPTSVKVGYPNIGPAQGDLFVVQFWGKRGLSVPHFLIYCSGIWNRLINLAALSAPDLQRATTLPSLSPPPEQAVGRPRTWLHRLCSSIFRRVVGLLRRRLHARTRHFRPWADVLEALMDFYF
jgi:hypothetical protein